jgi:predicted ATP-grasp superfamily ATP-dependent carboligase
MSSLSTALSLLEPLSDPAYASQCASRLKDLAYHSQVSEAESESAYKLANACSKIDMIVTIAEEVDVVINRLIQLRDSHTKVLEYTATQQRIIDKQNMLTKKLDDIQEYMKTIERSTQANADMMKNSQTVLEEKMMKLNDKFNK